MIKKSMFALVVAGLILICAWPCQAQEKVTPEEVYDLILKAVPVIEQLGEEGLAAFNDPQGEFSLKDTYVIVIDCAKMVMAAHPNKKLIGMDLSNSLDKNPDPAKRKNPNLECCTVANNPNGGWTEYYWEKLGEDQPKRKIGFTLKVPGTDYILVAGIYDDTTSIDELNAQLK